MAFQFSGKSVVVTGGAGFVGSHVVDAALDRGAKRVTVVDNFSTGFRELVRKDDRVVLAEGDLLDQPLLDKTFEGHDFVFHIAANADVKDGLKHPRKDVEQNIVATQNVLEAMRKHGIKHVAFTSTGSTYGESDVFPTPETAPFPIQTSLYGTSKVAAEGLCTSYALGYGMTAHIFRLVSMLGPRYSHGHVIDFWRRLRKDPTKLEVLGDGHQKKSYLHVLDCVGGMFLVCEKAPASEPIHIYNVGHHEWIEVNDSIRIICDQMKVKPTLSYSGGIRGWIGDSPKILLDNAKLRAFGWKPTKTIEEAIRETLAFLDANPYLDRA